MAVVMAGTTSLNALGPCKPSKNLQHAPRREADFRKRIVITGMGIVSTFGSNVDRFYDSLLHGQSAVDIVDKFDTSPFSTRFAAQVREFSGEGYINRKDDQRMDDCIRYCVVSGKKALEQANLFQKNLDKLDKERFGVCVSSQLGGLTAFSKGIEALAIKGYKRMPPHTIPYAIVNAPQAQLCIEVGARAPSIPSSASTATSNFCIISAANEIREGKADIMLAGGTEASVIPPCLAGHAVMNALSQRNDDPQTASRPWDKGRDGFVLGEGAGILVLESLEHALKRDAPIFAEYLGGAINNDAYHVTSPRPDGQALAWCIQQSLKDGGVSAEEVNYVNCHATSTVLGDLAEIEALKKVFRDYEGVKINATKSIIGHALGAAGGIEAIAVVKAITTGWLHPTINQFEAEECIPYDRVANKKQQHEVNVAVSNSFGFGGGNSAIVIAPFDHAKRDISHCNF